MAITTAQRPIAVKPLPGTKYGPAVAVVVSVTTVAAFVRYQLQHESQVMDRTFAQYQSPQSEASRQRVFGESGHGDPRRSLFNVLSWKGLPPSKTHE